MVSVIHIFGMKIDVDFDSTIPVCTIVTIQGQIGTIIYYFFNSLLIISTSGESGEFRIRIEGFSVILFFLSTRVKMFLCFHIIRLSSFCQSVTRDYSTAPTKNNF